MPGKKQQNKRFKGSSGGKRQAFKGVIGKERAKTSAMKVGLKIERKNASKQKLLHGRDLLVQKFRLHGQIGPSKLVALIPINDNSNIPQAMQLLTEKTELALESSVRTVFSRASKQFLTFIPVNIQSPFSVLDLCGVADIFCFVSGLTETLPAERITSSQLINIKGEQIIKMISGLGMPTPFLLIQNNGFEKLSFSAFQKVKKKIEKIAEDKIFTECKTVFDWQMAETVKTIFNIIPREIKWRENRPSLIALQAKLISQQQPIQTQNIFGQNQLFNQTNLGAEANAKIVLLGEVRNSFLSANQLISIPDVGDFAVEQIERHGRLGEYLDQLSNTSQQQPQPQVASHSTSLQQTKLQGFITQQLSQTTLVDQYCAHCSEELTQFAAPDALEGEQSFPPEKENEAGKILKDEEEDEDDSNEDNTDDEDEEKEEDDDEDEQKNNQNKESNISNGIMKDNKGEMLMDVESDKIDGKSDQNDIDDTFGELPDISGALNALQFQQEEDAKNKVIEETQSVVDVLLEEEKRNKEDRKKMIGFVRGEKEFPDEVDVPLDTSARERFSKYRGMRSFQSSPWDTKV